MRRARTKQQTGGTQSIGPYTTTVACAPTASGLPLRKGRRKRKPLARPGVRHRRPGLRRPLRKRPANSHSATMVTLSGPLGLVGDCRRTRAPRARLLTSQAGRARCPRRCCCSPLDRSQRRSARKHPRVSGVGSRGDSVLLWRSRLSSCRRGSCDAGLYHGRRAGSSTASSQCAAARCSCRRNQRSLDHGTTPGHTDQLEDEKECTGQVQRGAHLLGCWRVAKA